MCLKLESNVDSEYLALKSGGQHTCCIIKQLNNGRSAPFLLLTGVGQDSTCLVLEHRGSRVWETSLRQFSRGFIRLASNEQQTSEAMQLEDTADNDSTSSTLCLDIDVFLLSILYICIAHLQSADHPRLYK
jgi:hypothetical protein